MADLFRELCHSPGLCRYGEQSGGSGWGWFLCNVYLLSLYIHLQTYTMLSSLEQF